MLTNHRMNPLQIYDGFSLIKHLGIPTTGKIIFMLTHWPLRDLNEILDKQFSS